MGFILFINIHNRLLFFCFFAKFTYAIIVKIALNEHKQIKCDVSFQMNPKRSAVTVTEVLVCLALLAFLAAILVPAIQRVRESANALSCRNKLRVIASAMNGYVSDKGHFPSGGSVDATRNRTWAFHLNPRAPAIPTSGANQNWGWAYQILPYLGLEEQWKRREDWSLNAAVIPTMTYEQPVTMYLCPTRHRLARVLREDLGPNTGNAYAAIDYAANGGHLSFVDPRTGLPNTDRITPYPFPLTSVNVQHSGLIGAGKSYRLGGIVIDQPINPSDVADGASNTILLGEKRLNARMAYTPSIYINTATPQPGDQLGFCSGFSTDTIRSGAYWPQRDTWVQGQFVIDGFGATHPKACHLLFVDGSVRGFAYNLALASSSIPASNNLSLLQKLCHRSDGAAIDFKELD